MTSALLAARAAIDAGDPHHAYMLATTLMFAQPERADLHLAAGESLRWLGHDRLADLHERMAARPADHAAVLELAQELLVLGDAPLAVVMASRAVDLRPLPPALALLGLALAADFRPSEGLALLQDRRDLDFDAAFVKAWCSLLSGDVEPVLLFIEHARTVLRLSATDAAVAASRETWIRYLEHCLARRVTVERPSNDLRAWHFVQYGAAILGASPDSEGTGGRFTATWTSYSQITGLVKALIDLLIRAGRRPWFVVAAPGRDSAIVGRLAAKLIGAPFLGDGGEKVSSAGALVMAAHGRDLASLPLVTTQHAQTVFALDFDWLTPGPVVPDVCGMLTCSCTLPWHPETRMALAASLPGRVPSETEVVRRLLEAEEPASAAADAVTSFYAERAADLKGRRAGAQREAFRRDSPVSTAAVSWRGRL